MYELPLERIIPFCDSTEFILAVLFLVLKVCGGFFGVFLLRCLEELRLAAVRAERRQAIPC